MARVALMDNKAFSIIELVAVIIIFSIIALMAAARFGPYDAMKVDAAARKIASDITYAQMLAMTNANNCTSQQTIVIDFDIATSASSPNTYRIFCRSSIYCSATDPFTKESFFVNFNTGTYQGVRIESAVFIGSGTSYNNLGFTIYRGIPQACQYLSGGYIAKGLDSDGKIEISYRNKKRQVKVTKETGTTQVLVCDDISQGGACPP